MPGPPSLERNNGLQALYGCGGFFLVCENFGRMFDHSFAACAVVYLFIYFEVEISSGTLIPLFVPGSVHSGSAS